MIPISRLTDADRKWVLTAEYGGTGGRALEGGMVIEEPDIEIGAGVSSKGMHPLLYACVHRKVSIKTVILETYFPNIFKPSPY